METTLFILAAYLWGAVPSAYLVARYLKGIDIREYGSGNVGSSNLIEHVGRRTGFSLGVFDILAKGTLPVVVADLTGQSLAVQAGVGLAAIAGHNWSPYIGFTGGRGLATAGGVLLGLLMWKEILVAIVLIVVLGRLVTRDVAFWTLVALLTVPPLAYLFGQSSGLVYMLFGIALLLILKRLTANWETPVRDGRSVPGVLLRRLVWDRDVARRLEWMVRRPASGERN